ncbi:hypothetical protein BGV46_03685 [Serratia marcescens]|nr:hypothetical protein RN42_22260 [Serratia marcescens]OHT38855.1 hypothetical protein BGV45_03690 [Serratia marcescens]OHT41171.1 hypothetical protein BGV46_03685 [Serratia marcescens]
MTRYECAYSDIDLKKESGLHIPRYVHDAIVSDTMKFRLARYFSDLSALFTKLTQRHSLVEV